MKHISLYNTHSSFAQSAINKPLPHISMCNREGEYHYDDYSNYAVHRDINAPVMDIVYAQGWATNSDFMTFEEAAAVTNTQLSTVFGNKSNITHFEEFKYFTSITTIGGNFSNSQYAGFSSDINLSSIEFPPSLTTLSLYSLKNTGFTTIKLPDTITNILTGNTGWHNGGTSLGYCSKLISVIFSSNLPYIACTMFREDQKLESVTNIDHIQSIGGWAFYNCKALTSFTIPLNVSQIGIGTNKLGGGNSNFTGSTFYGCSGLTEIICRPITPPTLTGTDNFTGTTCQIKVPSRSLDLYRSTAGWSDIANRIVAFF